MRNTNPCIRFINSCPMRFRAVEFTFSATQSWINNTSSVCTQRQRAKRTGVKGEWEGGLCVVTLRRWVLAATPFAWIMAMKMGMSPSGLPFPPAILIPNASVGPCGETHTHLMKPHSQEKLSKSLSWWSFRRNGWVLTRVISTVRRPVSTTEMTQKTHKMNSVQIWITYELISSMC